MEMERQRYETRLSTDERGNVREISDKRVGPPEKFEFGGANDSMSRVIGGGYISVWSPDFLQTELGHKEARCDRFYFDRRVAVDIGDPESKISRVKRKLLFKHGFGYLCIPANFSTDEDKLLQLYQGALEEYYAYEKIHPRPVALQETLLMDEKGQVRRATVTAIDIKVGGGTIGSVEQQKRELAAAKKMGKGELRQVKLRAKMHRKLRISLQTGKPFRNPFVSPGKRLYPVEYATS